jgi:hypothetical protein
MCGIFTLNKYGSRLWEVKICVKCCANFLNRRIAPVVDRSNGSADYMNSDLSSDTGR